LHFAVFLIGVHALTLNGAIQNSEELHFILASNTSLNRSEVIKAAFSASTESLHEWALNALISVHVVAVVICTFITTSSLIPREYYMGVAIGH